MIGDLRGRHPITLGADKAYDVAGFVASLRDLQVTPHVARNVTNRKSAIDGRTTRHRGYEISQRLPKRIEEPFDWLKGRRPAQDQHKGMARVGWSDSGRSHAGVPINLGNLTRLWAAMAKVKGRFARVLGA